MYRHGVIFKIHNSYNLHTSDSEFFIAFSIKLGHMALFTKPCKCGLSTNSTTLCMLPTIIPITCALEKNFHLTQALCTSCSVYFLSLGPLLTGFSHFTCLNLKVNGLESLSIISYAKVMISPCYFVSDKTYFLTLIHYNFFYLFISLISFLTSRTCMLL